MRRIHFNIYAVESSQEFGRNDFNKLSAERSEKLEGFKLKLRICKEKSRLQIEWSEKLREKMGMGYLLSNVTILQIVKMN